MNIKNKLNILTKKDIIILFNKIINLYNIDIENYISTKNEFNPNIIEIFNYYNSKNIKRTKELNLALSKSISKTLLIYDVEKIKILIDRYQKILNDPNYYFKYKWNLKEFLDRKGGITAFDDEGSKWENYITVRPLVDINKYFTGIYKIYPKKENEEDARKEFENKFLNLTEDECRIKANKIYLFLTNYIHKWEEEDEKYIPTFSNWLRRNIR